ncbi:MAG: molybdopterin-dependent oxidoreductase [Thermodesulfobacteriota bacterium]
MSESPSGNNGNGIKRRDFLKIIGVAGGTAAITAGCSSDVVDKIIPYVNPPDDVVPGIPKWYSSTCTACPAGCGIVVKNREGRAIKVEGNPKSPVNSGALCARGQSLPQELYNPDRIKGPSAMSGSGVRTPKGWEAAENMLAERINDILSRGDAEKIVFLTNHVSGTFETLIKEWLEVLGGGRHVSYEAFSHEPILKASQVAFGRDEIPSYHIDKADYLLSLGADFLETWLANTSYQLQYSKMHSYDGHTMGRCIQIEPRMSLTGANADEWIAVKPGTEGFVALGMVNAVIGMGLAKVSGDELKRIARAVSEYAPDKVASITDVPSRTIKELARGFGRAKSSLALGTGIANSSTNATETQVAVNLLNYVTGNVGKTVDFSRPQTIAGVSSFSDMASLIDEMSSGEVELLLIHSTNPAFTLPGSLNFDEAVKKVPFVASFSSFIDETAVYADLTLPDHTTLESWDDYVPRVGVRGLVQPAVVPVFNTKQTGDVLLSLSNKFAGLQERFAEKTYYDYLRKSWEQLHQTHSPYTVFETFWRESVKNGGIYYDVEPVEVSLSTQFESISIRPPEFEGSGDMYFVAYPSARYYDGRGANKPWLQELPDALTTAVWDSWVELHPETAAKLGVEEGDFVSIQSPAGKIETQVFVYEGIRHDTAAVGLGLGHTSYGRYAEGVGVNPIDILPASVDKSSGGFAWLSSKVKVTKTGVAAQLVKTQYSMDQDGRGVAQAVTVDEIRNGHHETHRNNGHNGHPDMYSKHKYEQHRWGMSIDLSKCVGCGACVVACNAENNIPFVGKMQVAKRREMSWIRIDRFFEHDEDGALDVRFAPMPCQHCENAPCEPVCPVFATYKNPEGINAMIYSRCVGTRYCSNNCTYKVRRFNWYDYSFPEPLNWLLNPDVTVRTKGVMEKCTFCIQRIHAAKDTAIDEGRTVRDGEIVPACQQTCPSQAIVFGDINDPETQVSKLSKGDRGYKVFEEINTQPAVTYLKKVKWDKV